MKIPKTTKAFPYIEFRINQKGKVKLSTSSLWWGGINSGFITSDGIEGNTCEPKDLDKYIKAFKKKKIKEVEKEIISLQKQLELLKSQLKDL